MDADEQAALRTAYQEVCNSYHAIDDIRIGLLGRLPLVSGAGIALLLNPQWLNLDQPGVGALYPQIGAFGFIVSFGLLLYEIRGVQQCCALIMLGRKIEDSLHIKKWGQFTNRAEELIGIAKTSAARLVYPIVLAAWAYVAFFSFWWAEVAALCLFIGGFVLSFLTIRYFMRVYDIKNEREVEQGD
jgi:hypothetical protein